MCSCVVHEISCIATLCCQFQSSRCSYLFSCTHILLAVGERVDAGQFISVLTVRLQGALRLHQFTQQIGTPQSLLLDLAHVSPLYFNNKSVRLTRNSVLWLAILKNSLLRSQVKWVYCLRFISVSHRLAVYNKRQLEDYYSIIVVTLL